MPSVVPARRSRSSKDEGDDDASHEPSSGEVTPVSNGANKRAKTAHGNHRRATTDTTGSWDLATPRTVLRPHGQSRSVNPSATPGPALSFNSKPTHQPGAIVRVTLKDFVTYGNATFYPGPSLNMVIGPNGTGKSTLVCAICLGLGWGPKHLGRAKKVEDFIKHGAKKAIIEIELKGSPGTPNQVIKRQISWQNGGNNWWVNGDQSTERKVRTVAESFNIQIDNLCQFLPQDRVVEFANLKPVEKLTATIRAAAPQRMIDQHKELKDLRVQQRDAEQNLVNHKTHLASLEAKQNAQRGDVERVRERQQVVDNIDFQEKCRVAAEYQAALEEFKAVKSSQVIAGRKLAELEEQVEPTTRAAKRKADYEIAVSKSVKQRQNLYNALETQAEGLVTKMSKIADKIKECHNRRQAELTQRKNKAQAIPVIKAKIAELENIMKNEPPVFDGPAYNERMRTLLREIVDLDVKVGDLEGQKVEKVAEFKQFGARIKAAEEDIRVLQTAKGQRDQLLRQLSPVTADAWNHVQELISTKKVEFKDIVYGPAALEVSVKDESWAAALESTFQRSEMFAITVTNSEDWQVLSNILHGRHEGGKDFSNVSMRQVTAPLSAYVPPVEPEEAARLGISGWVIDHLQGPDAVLSMLCNERACHKTAILESEESERQYDLLTESPVDCWVTKTKQTRITRRREYDAFSTRTNSIKEAMYWVSQPVDVTAIRNHEQNIAEWNSAAGEIRDQAQKLIERRKELETKRSDLKEEKDKIQKEKDDAQIAAGEFLRLPMQLEEQNEKLIAAEDEERQRLERLSGIGQEEANLALHRGQVAIDYSNIICSMRAMHVQVIETTIAHLEARSDVNTLKLRNQEIETLLDKHRKDADRFREMMASSRAKAKQAKSIMDKMFVDNEGLDSRWNAQSTEERARKPEEIDSAIDGLRARLELLHGGNAGVLKEFEDRAKHIERLRMNIEEHDASLANVSAEIASIRSEWEPELDRLIAQISDAFGAFFAKIKCAGEVTIHKEGEDGKDFENWAVLLKVKFREEEGLSVLDSHRQSGGERAVSTMFYLMALQSLSQAPFRVVDEINQGMDPRNERCVHEMMVDVACGDTVSPAARDSRGQRRSNDGSDEDDEQQAENILPQIGSKGSQYFLITPKLLTGLKYKQGMKVHNIVSGELMPDDPRKLDLKNLIAKAKTMRLESPTSVQVAA